MERYSIVMLYPIGRPVSYSLKTDTHVQLYRIKLDNEQRLKYNINVS